jgi:hypothetical protein
MTMDIESVRALKAELSESIIGPLIASEALEHRFSVRSMSARRAIGPRRALALGISRADRSKQYRLAVRLQRRSLESDAQLRQTFETRARGEVDVRYIGRVLAHQAKPWHQERQRPLLIGASVAHHTVTAGTIGCFPLHRKTQRPVLLSNNHVLAAEDHARQGSAILQPGNHDGGRRPDDEIGRLLDWVPLKRTGNIVDAAIASLSPDLGVDRRTITGWGQLAGVRDAPIEPGDRVVKVGRTTGLREGVVTAIELDDVVVDFERRGALSFDRQIEIEGAGQEAFSAGGDSGSIIMDLEGRACALLFAGGDLGGTNGRGLTFGNPIRDVLQALGLAIE